MITGAMIEIDPRGASSHEAAATVLDVTAGGPFTFERLDDIGDGHVLVTFGLRSPVTTVGYRNVIELQHRLSAVFDIVGAERRMGVAV